MPVPLLSTLFALGVYIGNPNEFDANAEQAFENSYNSFVTTMSVKPAYLTSYINNGTPVGQWVGDSNFQAQSNAKSPVASTMIPVISLQLQSTDGSAGDLLTQFTQFAAGDNDAVVRQIVDAWADNGFTNVVFRLGAEMNIYSLGYAGDDTASQAEWVLAFQHVSRVLHNEAKARNITMRVMWNPDTTNYSNAHATPNNISAGLYPGDSYVDIIGVDIYADMYPYNDTFNPDTYHDWDTGGEDTSVAQFVADYVNGQHYWSYPAANINCLDCSGGHAQSLDSLIAFSLQHNKPFAIPETGAGSSWGGHDMNDQSAFPMWLAQELTTARAAGLQIAFVAIWDSYGGGNYEFTYPGDGKPNEAASWAKYFGPQPAFTSYVAPTIKMGTGADVLRFAAAEDAWQGDAQFTVLVDGQQVAGPLTATAPFAAGKRQAYALSGNWGPGAHTVTFNYLNDANGGTAATDRNLYVTGIQYDSLAPSKHNLYLLAGGPQSVTVAQPAP